MCNAQQLIAAVQSCNPDALRAVIAQLKATAAPGHNPVNDRLSVPLNLTALHVAAKAYSAHHGNARLAKVFDAMVAVLLEAGANPAAEMGGEVKKRYVFLKDAPTPMVCMTVEGGKTVAEVCEGKMPPALVEWFALNCDDTTESQVAWKVLAGGRNAGKVKMRRLAKVDGRQWWQSTNPMTKSQLRALVNAR